MKDISHYIIGEHLPPLREYLQGRPREKNAEQAPRHQGVCEAIKRQPSLVGLESRTAWFEEPSFFNRQGNMIMCPDLVGFVDECWFVVEVGAIMPVKQLTRAFTVLEMNFGVQPQLIGVKYAPRSSKYWCHALEKNGDKVSSYRVVEGTIETLLNPRIEQHTTRTNAQILGMGMLEAKDFDPWPNIRPKPRY